MTDDRLITVAIHTYDRALQLKQLLEREGVESVLHNVNLSDPVISSGVRVRIHESDLPLALRIIENTEIFTEADNGIDGHNATVIVPVDFSDYSKRAARIAFDIANRHKASIMLLHSFINPAVSRRVQLTDSFSFELAEREEIERRLIADARDEMRQFEDELKSEIKSGKLPPVRFSTRICEGVPEDVINDVAKSVIPLMIVMGTRGSGRKQEELIGSVTAELLDSCRFSVMTIPESSVLTKITDISGIAFFSNLEQEDFLAIDALHRLLSGIQGLSITIVHVPGKRDRSENISKLADGLLRYCRDRYPAFNFSFEQLRPGNVVDDFKTISKAHKINLVSMPNKHRNVFFRFFNPSLAHKLLLHADIPMMVIPV